MDLFSVIFLPLNILKCHSYDLVKNFRKGTGFMKRIYLISMLYIAVGTLFSPLANASEGETSFLPRLSVKSVRARVIATNIPSPSAISQVGTFIDDPHACAEGPIPLLFPASILPGAILDSSRILVCNRSNFGAPRAPGNGMEGSILSINPNALRVLKVPARFAESGTQASAFGGDVQMFTANSPSWLNSINNPNANTANFTGVGNPIGLSNNNAFGRIWPANSPFGSRGVGTSSILDPTGLPLKGAPNALIGGVYRGSLTNRNLVTTSTQPPVHPGHQDQIIPGALSTGAVGLALLGPGLDAACKATFAIVTADGAIVQASTAFGIDGIAPTGTINPLIGKRWKQTKNLSPRLCVLMNPYNLPAGVVRQVLVSEPFSNTIAVVDLVPFTTIPDRFHTVYKMGAIRRLHSFALDVPIDMTPTKRNTDDSRWASNTTLDEGSDIYVANRGNNTIVRMDQQGNVFAIREVHIKGLKNFKINGIATSVDGTKIYVTFVKKCGQGGVARLRAF